MKYVKKPIVVEAFQLGVDVVPGWFYVAKLVGEDAGCEIVDIHYKTGEIGIIQSCIIYTPEGDMTANKGDFIIKGVKGEIYPCKKDIFEATYEPFEERLELIEKNLVEELIKRAQK